ncbi:DUF5691 domain-containing protein [Dyella choica]|uniref:Uncharacterized protein n=1 Tax=Dyella choica TaxID=1927959 RepID=A0A3S0R3U9_9GAMM|nr:DUF5691 domain-containing protein [Dyella choica]RUL75913.1 hypothetical protein EKH80_09295 [Dyella choica]
MKADWFKQALVGVEGAVAFSADTEVGKLLAQIGMQGDDPALTFSRVAGVMAACQRAGLTLPSGSAVLPQPSPADDNTLADAHPWSVLLAQVLTDGPVRLQHEICSRLATLGITLPALQLPGALDAGKRSVALRPLLLKILGHRGRWLAAFNPDWRYAAEGTASEHDPNVWEEGNLAQRIAYLCALRQRDPARARQLLQAQLSELPARERVELVSTLEYGLEGDDEALLDPLLKDRSREVRTVAAMLLAKLPRSVHARRITGWLAPLLTQKRHLLGKTWAIDAPAAADPAWQTAVIDSNRPQHERLGERAWWLYQLVRQASLSWWVDDTGMTPAQLIAWAAKSDWMDALYRGWRDRVGAADHDWIHAMLASRAQAFGDRVGLLAWLPVAEREPYWPRSLDQLRQDGRLGDVIASCPLGETLSADFSSALMADIRQIAESPRLRDDCGLRPLLLELALIAHPSALLDWRSPAWTEQTTPALIDFIREFERIVAIRRSLHSPLS